MSFNTLCRLEAEPLSTQPSHYSDNPGFDLHVVSLSSQISSLNNTVLRLSSLLVQIGGRRDNETLRDDVNALLVEAKEAFKTIEEAVKRAQSWEGLSDSQRYTTQKLSRTLASILQQFRSLQRDSVEKTRQYILGASPALKNSHGTQSQCQPQFQLPQLAVAGQSEVEFQESMVLQREQEIESLQNRVENINAIYSSLTALVGAQGDGLGHICTTSVGAADNIMMADSELQHAFKWEKMARKRACCVLLLSAILFGAVLLMILLG